MLSYKFKHLISRVVASLSAFGILSITDHAHAQDLLLPNSDYKYTELGNITFTASYEGGCILSTNNKSDSLANPPRQLSAWLTKSTNASDSGRYCIYICDSHTSKSKTFYSGGADVGAGPHDSITTRFETAPKPGTYLSGIDTTTSVAGFVNALSTKGYEAPQDMQDAYSADMKNYTGQHALVIPFAEIANGTISVDDICIQQTFVAKFDCGDGEPNITGDNYTGAKLARYDSTIKLPYERNCIAPSGFSFAGWAK